MTKKTVTTITEEFDKDGKVIKRITETVIEERNDYYTPCNPNYGEWWKSTPTWGGSGVINCGKGTVISTKGGNTLGNID